MEWGKSSKGSVTVEAAVILPIIMSLIISFIFIIKLVHTHVIIQHAINDTANQLATYSYLYSSGGLQTIHDTAKDSLEKNSGQAEKDFDLLSGSWDSFLEMAGCSAGGDGKADTSQNIQQALKNLMDSGNGLVQNGKGISELTKRVSASPKDEVLCIGSLMGNLLLEDGKTYIIQPVIGYLVCKNLGGSQKDADTVLKGLSVVNGLEGLDFSDSTIFKDKKSIDIMVKYKLKLQLPVNILPEICIVQRSAVRAWLDGDGQRWAEKDEGSSNPADSERNGSSKEASDKKTVWDLSPKARGKILQTEQGRNLPDMFPTIAKYQNNTVYSIKSIDLTDVTYLKPLNLKYRVNGFVKELSEFKEAEYKNNSIKASDYNTKVLTLVVPKDSLNAQNRITLIECEKYARSLGITLELVQHSQKKSEE